MIDKIKNVKELRKAYCELEKEFAKKRAKALLNSLYGKAEIQKRGN